MRKRIAVVHPYTNLDSVPSIYNTVVLLAEHGYLVDVFTRFDNNHLRPKFDQPNITVMPLDLPPHAEWPRLWYRLPHRFYLRHHWSIRLWPRHRQAPYIAVIGVDPAGLVAAQTIAGTVSAPMVYYSLELLLSYEVVSEEDRALKPKELELSQRARLVIIQDEERAALLIRDNGVDPQRVVCVPNAPLGPAQRQRSDYLRRRYAIPTHKKIILHTGSLGAWTGAHLLMRSTQEWPDEWVLVCHLRYRNHGFMRDYIAALECLARPGSVIFSTDPLTSAEYPALVQSADIGVVYYCPTSGSIYTQDNIRYIGRSSGKLAYYLQAGVPVVMNDVQSLRRMADEYACGVIVKHPEMTCRAIATLLGNYDTYCAGATRCFQQEWDFSEGFQQVLSAFQRF